MASRRIIFMGTPEISSIYLQSLIDSDQNIIAVFTQPPRKKGRGMKIQQSPVHKLAEDNSINVFVPTDLNLNISLNEIKNLNPDLIVIMGYGIKIPSKLGTLGHSDGDPVLHAVIDSILGACQMGDIGQKFSNKNTVLCME